MHYHHLFNHPDTADLWKLSPESRCQDYSTNVLTHAISEFSEEVLSFAKDVAPADHPYYRQVTLRLMPAEGGAPRVIAYVYGGQGTLNVPSWSPDSRKLAFVSNSILP